MSEQKVQVTISGDASGLLTALQQAAKGTEDMAKQMETAVGGVASMLEHFAAPLATFLGMLGGGALFKEAISEASELGDSLAKGAQKAGMSVEALSGLAHAAKLSNVAFDDLVGGLTKLAKNMQEAVFTPTSKAAAAFKALGIEVTDAQGHLRNSDEVLGEVAEKFKGFEDGAGKTALAMNLFGKSGAQMIPLLNEGKEGIAELMAEAKRLGITMTTDQAKASEKYRDDMERVEAVMTGLKIRVSNEVMPALTRLAEWFTEQAPGMLETTTNALRALGAVLGNSAVQITAVFLALTSLGKIAIVQTALAGLSTAFRAMAVNAVIATSGTEGLTVAIQALGASMWSLLASPLALVAALAGLAYWAKSYSADAADMAEANQRVAESAAAGAVQFHQQGVDLGVLEQRVKSTKEGTTAHKEALDGVNSVVHQMVEIYPEFLGYLHKENGQYVDLTGSVERFTKSKLRELKLQLEIEQAAAREAKQEAFDAKDSNWSLFLPTKLLIMNGIAANAEREQRAHESTAQAIQRQIDALKGLAEGKTAAPVLAHPEKPVKESGVGKAQAAYDRWLNEEKRQWAQHQQDMVAIMDDGLDKQVASIRLKYDKMYETEKSFGADDATLLAIRMKEYRDIEQARTDWAKKQAEERKKIAEEEAKAARAYLEQYGTAQQGFLDGIQTYIQRQGTVFQQWSQAAQQMLHGVEDAFSRGFQGILTGQMSLAQGLKSIWQGITGAIVQMLAQLAAKWIVTAIAAKIFKDSASAAAKDNAVAQQESAASTLWATYSGIPFVGPAIAAAFIAMMNASLVANAAGAKGIVGAAEGGWFDRPTMTMIGEGKRPELVVPDVAFKDFAANLSANILAQERQAQGYGRQAAGYARGAADAGGGAGAMQEIHVTLSNVNILDSSQRGLQQLGNHVLNAIQTVGGQRGQVLVPGRVVTGGM